MLSSLSESSAMSARPFQAELMEGESSSSSSSAIARVDVDVLPDKIDFATDVMSALRAKEKNIPGKYIYDKAGSDAFEKECSSENYYIARSELNLMRESAKSISKYL